MSEALQNRAFQLHVVTDHSNLCDTVVVTYAADHCSTSLGCVLMAAFVNCFKISGNSGGIFICCEQ